ncbi:MAG: TolC family protein, partial [Deltaproteobacteria bacterium]|nr:TolC family protein [Deltaproteobacteria bacterium]
LPMLLGKAREASPSVEASFHSLRAAEAQLAEAKRLLIPTGNLEVLLAPTPRIDCNLPDDVVTTATPEERASKDWRARHCLTTPSMPTPQLVGIEGFMVRFELTLAWPIFTFGKLTAAREAASAGVSAGHGRVGQARAQVEHEVRRAYFGLKLARELRSTIDEGKGHLDDAIKKVKEDLDQDQGSSTVTDLRRLQVLAAEVNARRFETDRGEAMALAALRALIPGLKHFDIDDAPLEAPPVAIRPAADYVEQARHRRPEVRLIDAGLAARRAAVKLQRATFFPDLLIVGRLSYAYTSSAETPQNAFFNNPLNGLGFGGGLALRLSWDYGIKAARLARARAELLETQALRRAALGGIELEVEKARADIDESRRRIDATHEGERVANQWLNAVSQKHSMGLAETKEFGDALSAFFQMRLRWLQALYDSRMAQASLIKATGTE